MFGQDENSWNQYRANSNEERKQIIASVRAELKPVIEATERSKQQSELDAWASKEWTALESDPQVLSDLKKLGLHLDKNTQDEIAKVVSKYLPTDEETGNLSVRKGYEIWKDNKSVSSLRPNPLTNEKKQVADKTITKSNATEEVKDYKTSADFKGKSFNDLSR